MDWKLDKRDYKGWSTLAAWLCDKDARMNCKKVKTVFALEYRDKKFESSLLLRSMDGGDAIWSMKRGGFNVGFLRIVMESKICVIKNFSSN